MDTAAATEGATSETLRGTVLDVLRALLAEHRDDAVVELVAKLVSRNRELELLIASMRQARNRGERVSTEQLDLFLAKLHAQMQGELAQANQELEQAANNHGGRPEASTPPKQPPVRRSPPSELRRVDNVIVVPEAERRCPVCGAERTCIGHDTTEVIDLIPAEVIVRLDKREILVCVPCEGELVRAPLGDKVVSGGAYGSRLVADMVVCKYWDALPLHRQGQRYERLGLSIPSSSMADQITWATDLLRPIWIGLQSAVLGAYVMHLDATSLAVRDRNRSGGIQVGALWGYVGDATSAVYLYTSTGKKLGQRPGEVGPEEFLTRRRGFVVADASNLFDVSFQGTARIEVGCNMHARRYFVKALEAGAVRAAVPIAAFRALYDIEAAVRGAEAAAILEQRQRRSKPLYDELLRWCERYRPTEPPGSLLGKALHYQYNHRIALSRFLDNGRLPIDNGVVERLHRRPAVGRRNFLFAGSHAGAERAAIAYSVLASCNLVGVNPIDYLTDVLPQLTRGIVIERDVPAMLPAAWKAARAGPPPPGSP
jgi:transposase